MNKLADIGLIGLAVMGENLVLNMERNGYTVAINNRTHSRIDSFINGRGKGKNLIPCYSLEDLVASLARPRKIMLLIKAGEAVDQTIDQLLPLLEEGDLIIDGGNSYYKDTENRIERAKEKGILYVGTGVSGGEEGALNGPSLMPGGRKEAWPLIKSIFQDIAAKSEDGTPCCDWVGEGGSGHFVKMVHNGIEYGDMQVINEAYHLMKSLLRLNDDEQHKIFDRWNKGKLKSYLIEITSDILNYKDTDGTPLVEKILDTAGQKGTGKWTVESALEFGSPLTLIAESVFARCLSAEKDLRVEVSKRFKYENTNKTDIEKNQFVDNLGQALYASKIISYAQGFEMMKKADEKYRWHLNYGSIAQMWRGGCIIRSVFLDKIKDAYDKNSQLDTLLLDDFFADALIEAQSGWRKVCVAGLENGIPLPTIAAALTYFDGIRCDRLPSNLLQAQRDYFGAHMYERIDKERGEFFHTNWTGHGGDTASTKYDV